MDSSVHGRETDILVSHSPIRRDGSLVGQARFKARIDIFVDQNIQ